MAKDQFNIRFTMIFLSAFVLGTYLLMSGAAWRAVEANMLGVDLIAAARDGQIKGDDAQLIARLDHTPDLACRFPLYLASRPAEFQSGAQERLDQCLQRHTSRPELVGLGLVLSLAEQGKNLQAAALLQTNSELTLYFLHAIDTAIEKEELDRALALAELLDESGVYRSSTAYLKGKAYEELGNTEAAREQFEAALAYNDYTGGFTGTDRYATLYELGTLAAGQRDWNVALDSLTEATQLNPESAFAWMRLGLIYLNGFQDYARAEVALNTSLHLGDLAWAHWGVGRIQQERSDLTPALAEMLQAYAISGDPRFLQDVAAVLAAMSAEELEHVAFDMLMSHPAGDSALFQTAAAVYEGRGLQELADQLSAGSAGTERPAQDGKR